MTEQRTAALVFSYGEGSLGRCHPHLPARDYYSWESHLSHTINRDKAKDNLKSIFGALLIHLCRSMHSFSLTRAVQLQVKETYCGTPACPAPAPFPLESNSEHQPPWICPWAVPPDSPQLPRVALYVLQLIYFFGKPSDFVFQVFLGNIHLLTEPSKGSGHFPKGKTSL